MAKIDLTRDLEIIAERRRLAERIIEDERSRKRRLIQEARERLAEFIQHTKGEILKGDPHAFLVRNMWRYMGQARFKAGKHTYTNGSVYANLEFLNCIQTFPLPDAVELTIALYAARMAGGTLEDLEKIGVTFPKVERVIERAS